MYILRYKSFNKMLSTVWKKCTCWLYSSKRHRGVKLGTFENDRKHISEQKGFPLKRRTLIDASQNTVTETEGTTKSVHVNGVSVKRVAFYLTKILKKWNRTWASSNLTSLTFTKPSLRGINPRTLKNHSSLYYFFETVLCVLTRMMPE